jgi:hypothetical protein
MYSHEQRFAVTAGARGLMTDAIADTSIAAEQGSRGSR